MLLIQCIIDAILDDLKALSMPTDYNVTLPGYVYRPHYTLWTVLCELYQCNEGLSEPTVVASRTSLSPIRLCLISMSIVIPKC